MKRGLGLSVLFGFVKAGIRPCLGCEQAPSLPGVSLLLKFASPPR